MAQVTELVTKFSFTGSLSPLNQFNGGLGKAIKGLGLYTVAVKATVGVVMAFAGSILKSADAQVQLSNNTNVSIERIQELGYAASMSGSSSAALEQSLSGLSSSIGKAARQGSADFSRLGISVRDTNGKIKSADQILSEVSQRFKSLNISMSEQRTIAQSLGIDPSLVQMLNKTSGEMAVMTQKARSFGLITSGQKKSIDAFNRSVTTLMFAFQSIGRQLSIALAPIMTDIIKKFIDFLQANQDLIKGGLEKLSKILFFISEAVDRFINLIFDIVDAIGGWKNALILLSIVFLTTPIGQFIMLITAIIFIIDDLITAFQGGDSVIRNFFLDAFGFDIVPMLKDIVSEVKWFLDLVGDILSGVTDIFMGIFTLDGDRIMSGIGTLLDAVKNFIINALGNLTGLFASIFGFDPKPVMETITNAVTAVCDTIKQVLSGLKDVFVGIFTLDGDKVISGVKTILTAIWDLITGIFSGLFGLWSSGWKKSVDVLKNLLTKAFDLVTSVVMKPVEAVKGLWNKVTGLFGGEDEKEPEPQPRTKKPQPAPWKETSPKEDNAPVTQSDATGKSNYQNPAEKTPDPSKGFNGGNTNIQNNRTVQQNIDMQINSTDPVVAGQVAADGINQHLNDAENMNLVRNR